MRSDTIEIVNSETGEVRHFTTAQYVAERDRLLTAWQAAKDVLDAAKEAEMTARKAAVYFMADPEKTGSTENVELGNGYKAKLKIPLRYTFIKNDSGRIDKARIEKALQKIEKDGEVGELIAERLVKWTPELSLTEYNQLSEKHRKVIDDVIVTSEGAPTLDIVEPKGKK